MIMQSIPKRTKDPIMAPNQRKQPNKPLIWQYYTINEDQSEIITNVICEAAIS